MALVSRDGGQLVTSRAIPMGAGDLARFDWRDVMRPVTGWQLGIMPSDDTRELKLLGSDHEAGSATPASC